MCDYAFEWQVSLWVCPTADEELAVENIFKKRGCRIYSTPLVSWYHALIFRAFEYSCLSHVPKVKRCFQGTGQMIILIM